MLARPGRRAIGRIPLTAAGNYGLGRRRTPDGRGRCACDRRGMTELTPPVLVGIDGTPSGLEALALGSAFAVLTGSPLLLGAVFGYEGGAFAGGLLWPSKGDADRWLEEAHGRLGDAIPWSSLKVLSTSPAHGLVTLAKAEGARMIVLGSSRGGLRDRVLAGSTGRQVVHGAPCAVAVAPHDWRLQPPETPLTLGAAVSESPESRDALALAAELAAATHRPLRVLTDVPNVLAGASHVRGDGYELHRLVPRPARLGREDGARGGRRGRLGRGRRRDRDGGRSGRAPCRGLARARSAGRRLAALRAAAQCTARERVHRPDRTGGMSGRHRAARRACASRSQRLRPARPRTHERMSPRLIAAVALAAIAAGAVLAATGAGGRCAGGLGRRRSSSRSCR